MSEPIERRRLIAIVGLVVIILAMFMVVYEYQIYSEEIDKSPAVYTLIPEGEKTHTIEKGQLMYFSEGALTCEDIESIKKYYTYINSGQPKRIVGISGLFIRNLCGFSGEAGKNIEVIEIEGIFIQFKPMQEDQAWIINTELGRQ